MESGSPPESGALGARFRNSCVVADYPDRHLVWEVGERPGEDEVPMASPLAHGPSSWVFAGRPLGLALWEVLVEGRLDTMDALVRAEAGAADADVDAVVDIGLAPEHKALAHGDDGLRLDEVAIAQESRRDWGSAVQRSVRQIEEGSVDMDSELSDGVPSAAAAVVEVEAGSGGYGESEDEEVIHLVVVYLPAMRIGVGVCCREVLDPCLCAIYVQYLHT